MSKEVSVMKAGQIELSGKVIVSDPCYNRVVWCSAKNIAVKPGKYSVLIVKSNEQDAGIRVAYIIAIHEEYAKQLQAIWEPCNSNIGVDSGQCGIFDDTIYPMGEISTGEYDDESTFYGECCKLTLSDAKFGILKSRNGVVSSSGFGDGVYKLFCQHHKEERVALMVDFGLIEESEFMRAFSDHRDRSKP